jgi:hypothetical protein
MADAAVPVKKETAPTIPPASAERANSAQAKKPQEETHRSEPCTDTRGDDEPSCSHSGSYMPASDATKVFRLCLLKILSRMTRVWPYGSEAADGRVSEPAAACYPVAIHAASAA